MYSHPIHLKQKLVISSSAWQVTAYERFLPSFGQNIVYFKVNVSYHIYFSCKGYSLSLASRRLRSIQQPIPSQVKVWQSHMKSRTHGRCWWKPAELLSCSTHLKLHDFLGIFPSNITRAMLWLGSQLWEAAHGVMGLHSDLLWFVVSRKLQGSSGFQHCSFPGRLITLL